MSAPKRDKFAALAAAQGGRPPSSSSAADSPAPAASALSPPAAAGDTSVPSADSDAGTDRTTAAISNKSGVRGGGKFAALQKASTTKRDKFSALTSRAAAATTATEAVDSTKTSSNQSNEKVQEWTTKCQQREGLWKDLEDAEVHVLDVLEYAQQTVECFARQTTTDAIDPAEIQELSSQVQDCIRKIHEKLAPAAQFIQAYRAPERINKLYQVRVEEGLAVQKERVLQELVELEYAEKWKMKKRKRDE